MTLREAIIKCAKRQDDSIGDDAMITQVEWGFWVGSSIYVSKGEVSLEMFKAYSMEQK